MIYQTSLLLLKKKKTKGLNGVNHAKPHINKPRINLISLAHPEMEFQNSQSGIAWSALLGNPPDRPQASPSNN